MRWMVCALSGALAVGSGADPAPADGFQKDIMAGPRTGTEMELANDISEMVGHCGIELDVIESQGGLDNFLGVRVRPNTQMGFSRNDVLEYVQTYAAEEPGIADALEGMRVVMPLHQEEVQILAGIDVDTLADLDGKRVAIGPPGSATFITASLILDLAGVEPAERLAMAWPRQLPALLDGEIDAMVYVDGAPTRVYASAELDPERWHLVPIDSPTLTSVYEPVTVPANTYSFQPEPVETVAAQAVLLAYEFDPSRNAYHRESCRAISDVTHLISERLEDLRAYGHPKWKTIDARVGALTGWELNSCAARGLQPDYELDCDYAFP